MAGAAQAPLDPQTAPELGPCAGAESLILRLGKAPLFKQHPRNHPCIRLQAAVCALVVQVPMEGW